MELSSDVTRHDLNSGASFQAHPQALSAHQIKARIYEVNVERMLSAVRPMLTPKRYDVLFDFFKNHLFMPADRVSRDQAVADLYEKMKSVNVMDFATNLRESVELIQLANELDDSLVAILRRRNYASDDLIDAREIDSAIYEENRQADRQRVVELLGSNFRFFHRMSNIPLSRFMLPSFRAFARATGVSCLVAEIDAGYQAAKSIDDIETFVGAIWTEECRRLDELFGAEATN
jgi:hypothetical protein